LAKSCEIFVITCFATACPIGIQVISFPLSTLQFLNVGNRKVSSAQKCLPRVFLYNFLYPELSSLTPYSA